MEGINLDLVAGNLNPREFAYIQQSELDKINRNEDRKKAKFTF